MKAGVRADSGRAMKAGARADSGRAMKAGARAGSRTDRVEPEDQRRAAILNRDGLDLPDHCNGAKEMMQPLSNLPTCSLFGCAVSLGTVCEESKEERRCFRARKARLSLRCCSLSLFGSRQAEQRARLATEPQQQARRNQRVVVPVQTAVSHQPFLTHRRGRPRRSGRTGRGEWCRRRTGS